MRALKISNTITNRDERSLDRYLNDISKFEVLSPEEEVELFNRIGQGDEDALLDIINHNLRFVVSVAKKYQHMGLWLGDLINEGNIGLIKAAKRFDNSRGFKFISYAVWWIRQSILSAINEKSKKIRLPLNVKVTTSQILAKKAQILQTEEREASLEELAHALDVSEERVKQCMVHFGKCQSLDAPLNDDGISSLIDVVVDESVHDPDYQLEEKESIEIIVKDLIGSLGDRQGQVLSMYFGIGYGSSKTLQDIAEHMGVSRERVRQIRDRGLRKLRIRARHIYDPVVVSHVR